MVIFYSARASTNAPFLLYKILQTGVGLFFLPIALPGIPLQIFVPLLVWTFYRYSRIESLYFAVVAGLLCDLLSSTQHMGLYTASYLLSSHVLYPCSTLFFEGNLWTLPLLTFFFSIISSICYLFFYAFFEGSITLTWQWFFCDMLVLPSCDFLYALLWFEITNFLPPLLKQMIHIKRSR